MSPADRTSRRISEGLVESVLFIDYATTVKLLSVTDAMAICEDVFRMHARSSVKWSAPPSQKLDVGAPFHNHLHVKTVILEDEPIAGVRLYSYYDDGMRNTVGRLDCARYVVLADPRTGHPIAILDEHWTYAIRSAAAAMVALKWLGPRGLDPAGWAQFDKVVIDDWDCNMPVREFRDMIDAGQFDRTRLHADIGEVVAGLKPGRERDDERILIHTTGMVSHDIGIAWRIYRKAVEQGLGIALPTAVAQAAFGPKD